MGHPVQSWTSRALLFGSFSGRSLSFEERLYGTSLFPCPHPRRPRELAYTVGFRTQQSQLDNLLIAEMPF
jgi:hypothetical protein